MQLQTVKKIYNLPFPLHSFKSVPIIICNIDDPNIRICLNLPNNITGFVFIAQTTNQICAVHLYRDAHNNQGHSRAMQYSQHQFLNKGNFSCFDPNDQFQTTVEKFIQFTVNLANQ